MRHQSSREEFKARVMEWADRLEVKVRGLYLRPMRSKWASYSTAGTISFNDELPGMERELWDYAIVHELLHSSVPNHGKLWKSLMRAYLGDYERAERALLDAGLRGRTPKRDMSGKGNRKRCVRAS
jgi:predicted metal-dependent hydrolase